MFEKPVAAEVSAVVVSAGPREHDRATAFFLRDFREILCQPHYGSDAGGVICCGFEPSVAMGQNVDGFIRGPRQSSPHGTCLQIRLHFDVEANLHVRSWACASLPNEIANRVSVIHSHGE